MGRRDEWVDVNLQSIFMMGVDGLCRGISEGLLERHSECVIHVQFFHWVQGEFFKEGLPSQHWVTGLLVELT